MKQLKYLFVFSILFSMSFFLSNCGTTGASVNNSAKQDLNVTYLSLADYLRTKGGIMITGMDNDIRLQIRGINSIKGDTRPFIYIDGTPIGRSYQQANNAVNPNMIASIRIISSLSQLAIYGENGNSGIIFIKTKH